MDDNSEIQINEALCDRCGVIGQSLYHLYYSNGQRIASSYCLDCAEERRDELLK